jgi:hypothetical protein
MQKVPKIVVKRLQSPSAESHPVADLLTAFAERSLAARERERVLEHLARCGDCRDIVALALPATETVDLAKPGSTRAGWLSLPVLRWGVVAAGIVAVTVGVEQYRQRYQEKMVATSLMARNQPGNSAMQNPPSSSQESVSQTVAPAEAGKQVEMHKKAASRAQSAMAADKSVPSAHAIFPQSQPMSHATSARGIGGGSGAAIGSGSGRSLDVAPRGDMAYMWRAPEKPAPAATANQNPVPGPAQRPATTGVEVSGAAPAVTTQTTAQDQILDQPIQNESAEQAQSTVDRVGKAKPALAQSSPASMAPAPTLGADSSLMKSPAPPRWSISSSGVLQRSFDGGKTWLDVTIAADNSMSSNLVRRSSTEMQTVMKTDAKAKARSSAPPVKSADAPSTPSAITIFRALSVSANAAEVWAGGSGGALYHTIDGGNLWVRVLPSAAGVALTGDIVSIQFSDTRNGTVTTSNAEFWTTNDGGQTWRKQE